MPVCQKKPQKGYHITCLVYHVVAISTSLSLFPLPFASPTSLMVHRHISDDLKEMALSMSLQGLSDSVIHGYTRISEYSLKRLQSSYCATGAVSCKALDTGHPCVLTAIEVKVHHNVMQINYKLTVSIASFFATVLNVPLMLPLLSCKLSSMRCLM